ncbi:hypothetical protein BRAS3843_700042 [Bradyrhizobium sp. STM 3843]|nr:hypothetical protein BRAS3843_700042 [Bradyrhizobium sp. STM 3843]
MSRKLELQLGPTQDFVVMGPGSRSLRSLGRDDSFAPLSGVPS